MKSNYEYWHRIAKSVQPEWLERILNNANLPSVALIQSHLSLKVQTSYILAVPLNVFSWIFDFLVIWVAGIRVILQQTKRSVWAIKNFCILNPHKVLEDTEQHFIRQLGYQGESAANWALCNYFFFSPMMVTAIDLILVSGSN